MGVSSDDASASGREPSGGSAGFGDRERSSTKRSSSKRAGATTGAPAEDAAERAAQALEQEVAKLSYEEAIEALEEIIDRVERGDIGLEATLEEYRRGRALLRRCQSVLDAAEQEITRLSLTDLEALGRGKSEA